MATGYSSSTLSQAGDFIYDYPCTTCEDDGLNAEAFYFCKQCSKQFCNKCVKLHEKFSPGHKSSTLGQADVKKWGVVKRDVPLPRCEIHTEKERDLYCQDHDRVCCYVCMTELHRACKTVKHVPDVAKGIRKDSSFKNLTRTVTQTQKQLKDLKAKLHKNSNKNSKALKDACIAIKTTIASLRQKIDALLDQIEKATIQETDVLLASMEESNKSQVESCTQLDDMLQQLTHDIQTKGKDSEAYSYAGYKICQEKVVEANSLLAISNEAPTIKFTPDIDIEQYLSTLELLGEFHTTGTTQCASSLTNHAYTVTSQNQYNVASANNKHKCVITGIEQLANGNIVLVDRANCKVKLLNQQYSVVDELELHTNVCGMCSTGDGVAVTVYDWGRPDKKPATGGEIHFIQIRNNKLKLTRKFAVNHQFAGLAMHDGQLYVGSWDTIYIYTMAGKMVKVFYQDQSAHGTVCRFRFSNDGNRLYVTDYVHSSLICLDMQANILATITDPDLKEPTAICIGKDGQVFVCDHKSDTVLQFDMQLKKKLAVLAGPGDYVKGPWTVLFNSKTSELIVGQRSNNCLMVLKLK